MRIWSLHPKYLDSRGLVALWRWALRLDPSDPVAFAGFYQRVWQLFFCEYLLVPLAYLVG